MLVDSGRVSPLYAVLLHLVQKRRGWDKSKIVTCAGDIMIDTGGRAGPVEKLFDQFVSTVVNKNNDEQLNVALDELINILQNL